MLDKPLMKVLMKVPFVDERLESRIRKGLLDAFGGNLRQIIIGGAGLNKDVETFLRKISFPFTVGYGMTGVCAAGGICAMGGTTSVFVRPYRRQDGGAYRFAGSGQCARRTVGARTECNERILQK